MTLTRAAWKQRLLFFFAGLFLAGICSFTTFYWMSIVPYDAYDQQPGWLKGLKGIVGWLPWIAVVLVLAFRLAKGRQVRFGSYLLGTLIPTAIIFAWLLFGESPTEVAHRRQFDAATWRNQGTTTNEGMWPPRLCMVDDLMSSGRLDGLDRNQVLDLLGPPHNKSFPLGAVDCDIHYYLGPERGFIRIDSEWLFITFDKDGKVSRYWLYKD